MDKCREVVTTALEGGEGNPPYYAPPLLRHGNLLISQTSNILMYLGPKLGLSGSEENDAWRVNALVLTALDGLSNEVLDCLPKHLGYWEKVLKGGESGKGTWLLGEQFTYADLVLFQCLDGTHFAFPRAINQARESGKSKRIFQLYEDVKGRPSIAAYLASERKQKYDWGIYRYYPENDGVAD
ncbi:glutathione S-transferase [Phaeosphaeriaceae sp. PMI808]|nr:glutathione S-transferase [Phaeosphaeriaceae sp. PMI808]